MLTIMNSFTNKEEYLTYLRNNSYMPLGFQFSTNSIAFIPEKRPSIDPYTMDISLIMADEPTSTFAGVFTNNRIPSVPVILAKERMKQKYTQALLVNNRISNVATKDGMHHAAALCDDMGKQLSIDPSMVLSVSTGIIGWPLPIAEMLKALPQLARNLNNSTAIDVAHAIMTTDSFPKMRGSIDSDGSILAIAKGAGMIEPNLATMLVFILTDIDLKRKTAQKILFNAVDSSFNRISIDGDQSTSDMVLLLSSQKKRTPIDEKKFARNLTHICCQLAEDIVRNGEGVSHVIEITVSGAHNNQEARSLGKAILNSPLVGTAIYGNDPNIGRIICSIGDWADSSNINLDIKKMSIKIGDEIVFADGYINLDNTIENKISSYLQSMSINPRIKGFPQHFRKVVLTVALARGQAKQTVIGSDLSSEYIHENADYRS